MQTYHDTYTTRLGTEFKFAFVLNQNEYEIHITEQPSYGDRSDDPHITHRLATADGYKVCWTGALTSLADAKRVAALWSHASEKYILTGQPFPTA